MRVTYGKAPAARGGHRFSLGAATLEISDVDDALHFRAGTLDVFLAGTIYSDADGEKLRPIAAARAPRVLAQVFTRHGPDGFVRRIEGMYAGCWVDAAKGKAGLFADPLNRKPFFYRSADGTFDGSTNLAHVVAGTDGGRYNQLSLYAYFVVGYPPLNETFYAGVARLGADEFVDFSAKGAKHRVAPVVRKIEPFDRSQLDRYDELITNAVGARSSARGNVVMNSGGWDSTSLIYLLTRHHTARNIRSVVFDVLLPDGQSFNIYEVDKAKRIGRFYGIKTERAVIDYRDKNLPSYWESQAENLREHHVYFWLHHLKMADLIGRRSDPGTAVFNGEASDSIHNFGYSQFVSVNYDNMLLREYADKAKSYLYGPTFFKSVVDGSWADDKVVQFFHNYYGAQRFEDMDRAGERERRASYFRAFMLSYPRVPFAKWQVPSVAGDKLQKQFADHVQAAYFDDIASRATPDTLYYWLLQLYRRFHFQSFQIGVNQAALQPHGLTCAMPFLDAQMLDYMYRMPEDWGRGLEIRTTKYPLRYLANERWRMPIGILEEPGPHSYIAESDKKWSYAGGSWNIYCEIMFKSVFQGYFKDLFARTELESVFDPMLFDVTGMQRLIDGYRNGAENPADVGLLFKLAVLFSIGLYR